VHARSKGTRILSQRLFRRLFEKRTWTSLGPLLSLRFLRIRILSSTLLLHIVS
jgi:hypothetical protein